MNSKAARQREILRQRKYPDPDFSPGNYHHESRDEITSYIANGAVDTNGLHKRLIALKQIDTTKVGLQRRISANIDMIERFLEMLDKVDLGSTDVCLGHHNPRKMKIHNVTISVRPDLIITGHDKKGKCLKGGIKLQLSKVATFDEDTAKTVSAVVQTYLSDHDNSGDAVIYAPYCQVIDVAAGFVFPGVKSITQRMKDVAAECQNIAALWPSV